MRVAPLPAPANLLQNRRLPLAVAARLQHPARSNSSIGSWGFVAWGVWVVKMHPHYRLEGGQVVVQEQEGGRWSVIDRGVAEAMLSLFNGMTVEAVRATAGRANESEVAPDLRRVA
jgi:hypothetical protein